MYQSVLTRVTWGGIGGSAFLGALRDAARQPSRSASRGRLSVKFNVDGFSMTPGARFMTGRIAGTIGPAEAGEPGALRRGAAVHGGRRARRGVLRPGGRG